MDELAAGEALRAPTPFDDVSLGSEQSGDLDSSSHEQLEEREDIEGGSSTFVYYPSEGTMPRERYSDPARDAQIEAEYLPNVLIAKATSLAQEWAAAIASTFELPQEATTTDSPRREKKQGGLGINSAATDSPQVQEVSFRPKKRD